MYPTNLTHKMLHYAMFHLGLSKEQATRYKAGLCFGFALSALMYKAHHQWYKFEAAVDALMRDEVNLEIRQLIESCLFLQSYSLQNFVLGAGYQKQSLAPASVLGAIPLAGHYVSLPKEVLLSDFHQILSHYLGVIVRTGDALSGYHASAYLRDNGEIYLVDSEMGMSIADVDFDELVPCILVYAGQAKPQPQWLSHLLKSLGVHHSVESREPWLIECFGKPSTKPIPTMCGWEGCEAKFPKINYPPDPGYQGDPDDPLAPHNQQRAKALQDHMMEQHVTDKKYQCRWVDASSTECCDECCDFESHYLRHFRVHSGDRPFVCTMTLDANGRFLKTGKPCGMLFKREVHLTRHKRTHITSKPSGHSIDKKHAANAANAASLTQDCVEVTDSTEKVNHREEMVLAPVCAPKASANSEKRSKAKRRSQTATTIHKMPKTQEIYHKQSISEVFSNKYKKIYQNMMEIRQHLRVEASMLEGAGNGLFTEIPIKEGQFITFYDGKLVSGNGDLGGFQKQDGSWDAEFGADRMISAALNGASSIAAGAHMIRGTSDSRAMGLAVFVNSHSTKQNAKFVWKPVMGGLYAIPVLRAIKDIPACSEIYILYARGASRRHGIEPL